MTFDQTNCHVSQVGEIILLANPHDPAQVAIESGMVFLDCQQPLRLDVFLSEYVRKFRSFRAASDRRSKLLVLVERGSR